MDLHVPKLTVRALELPADVVTAATLLDSPCGHARTAKSTD